MKFAHNEFLAAYEHLYDKEERLFFRDARYFSKKEKNGEKMFWSRIKGLEINGNYEKNTDLVIVYKS